MSVVETNRKQLETLGDYVTRANIDWFAVFPDKLAEFEQIAARNQRESHLIIYRTRAGDERDHHVIPISSLSDLLTVDSLTHSHVNGTTRWNVTLKDHVLRVSHNAHSVDASQYFRLPLPIETRNLTPTATSEAKDLEPPTTQRIASSVYRILRDTELARQLKQAYAYCCQICGYSIKLADGSYYAEAHHIRPLGKPHCGPDCLENLIVLCPNHHAMCDYGAIKLVIDDLRIKEGHNIDPKYIAYHNKYIF
jgi:predicted restriction endonuclease